jgi:hypothetical protein
MMNNSAITVYEGSRGRFYYRVNQKIQPVFYDIEFPLLLALQLEAREGTGVGHHSCKDCQDDGMYRNVAVTLCSRCVQEFPEYVCDCVQEQVNIGAYVLLSDNVDNTRHLSCGPHCIWFADNGIYGCVNFRGIGLSHEHQQEWNRVYYDDWFDKEYKKTMSKIAEVQASHALEEKISDAIAILVVVIALVVLYVLY